MIRRVFLLALVAGLLSWSQAEAGFSLLVHTGAMSSNSGLSVTTPSIDTTGATLLVLATAQLSSDTTAPTDSKGNTWTGLTASSGGCRVRLWYVVNPIVGTGHTFSLSLGTAIFPALTVSAWTGHVAAPFDVESGNTSAVATVSTGSITPYGSDELLIAAACHDGIYASTINSSFTISDDEQGAASNAYGNTMAYLVQGAASAVNPTFSGDGSNHNWAAVIAAFKAVRCVVNSGIVRGGCI